MATQTFQQLLVWQKAHAFVLGVYKYTNAIAEGYKKKGKADKARLRNFYTNGREGGKTLSSDMQWHLSFRLTVFPAIDLLRQLLVKCFNHTFPKFYLLTPNFYILCSI
jgi:hypothetical protein